MCWGQSKCRDFLTMDGKKPGSWNASTGLARAILHDRGERRKWLVLFWWGGCAVATCVVLLFALYDALAVIREERAKSDVGKR